MAKTIKMPTIIDFKRASDDYEKSFDLNSLLSDFLYCTDANISELEREKLDEANQILSDIADRLYNEGRRIGTKLISIN